VQEAIDYGKFDPAKVQFAEFDPDDTLGVGEKTWLISYAKKAKAGDKDFERFGDFVEQHLAVRVRFCSPMASDDASQRYCWEKCSAAGRC
jgi:hypothetical protein